MREIKLVRVSSETQRKLLKMAEENKISGIKPDTIGGVVDCMVKDAYEKSNQ